MRMRMYVFVVCHFVQRAQTRRVLHFDGQKRPKRKITFSCQVRKVRRVSKVTTIVLTTPFISFQSVRSIAKTQNALHNMAIIVRRVFAKNKPFRHCKTRIRPRCTILSNRRIYEWPRYICIYISGIHISDSFRKKKRISIVEQNIKYVRK